MRWKLGVRGCRLPSWPSRNKVRPHWITTKERANTSPRGPNACGILAAMTSATSMMAKSIRRIGRVSGTNQFVTQQVYCQPSQTANQRTNASTDAFQVVQETMAQLGHGEHVDEVDEEFFEGNAGVMPVTGPQRRMARLVFRSGHGVELVAMPAWVNDLPGPTLETLLLATTGSAMPGGPRVRAERGSLRVRWATGWCSRRR